MAKSNKQGGQRKSMGSASGQKSRSPTANPHVASREEPSHIADRRRTAREKKAKRAR